MREFALRLGIDLGSTLSEQEIALLTRIGTERQLERGRVLHRQGDPANRLHLLISGSVKSLMLDQDGQVAILRVHLAGSLVGLSALTTSGHWDASAVALSPVKAITIGRADFIRLLGEQAALSLTLVRLLADRLSDLHYRVGTLQARTVEQRLACVLVSLSRPDPATSDRALRSAISLTHEELACLINTRRQTVTGVLKRFANAGFIVQSTRRIDVEALDALARLF